MFDIWVVDNSVAILVPIIMDGLFFPLELRPRSSLDDVREQNGTDLRQGSFLRFRPCVLRQGRHWTEGPHHGTQLHSRQERGKFYLM